MRRRPAILATVGALALAVLIPAPAFAASPNSSGSSASTGADTSWPQCGGTFPAKQAFGIVGVNGGTAGSFNPCVAAQVAWAGGTSGATAQPKAALYINTANPAGAGAWWPSSDSSKPDAGKAPYPTGALPVASVTYPSGAPVNCGVTGTQYGSECAYVYGFVRAEQAVEWTREQVTGLDPSAFRWWLDVETSNTWQSDKSANAASLAGAAAYLKQAGLGVGAYSTTAQWTSIVGGTGTAVPKLPNGTTSPLVNMDEWGAGASSLKGAQSNCSVKTFTGGAMRLTQYLSGSTDFNVSCQGYAAP